MAKKVLIIEDDKFLRELIAKKLAKDGYEVSEAVDGEEGVKKTKETKNHTIEYLEITLENQLKIGKKMEKMRNIADTPLSNYVSDEKRQKQTK